MREVTEPTAQRLTARPVRAQPAGARVPRNKGIGGCRQPEGIVALRERPSMNAQGAVAAALTAKAARLYGVYMGIETESLPVRGRNRS